MTTVNIFATYCRKLTPTKVRYIFKKDNTYSNNLTNTLLEDASFNIFLSNLNILKHFNLHINIIVYYSNSTYKKFHFMKTILNNNANKYLNINLNNYIKPSDLNNFKAIFIDIYTKNIFLYFSKKSTSKMPYISLKFKTYDNSYNNFYNFNSTIKSDTYHYQNNMKNISGSKTTTKENHITNYIVPRENITSSTIPSKALDIRKLFYNYKKKRLYYLLKKFLNKYITVKVEFNGIKILKGYLNKITSNTITLCDNDFKHVICLDSISVITSNEHINADNLIYGNNYSDISIILNYLKDNKINLKLDDKDLNIKTVEIIACCDSFLEVEDIENKKTYYLNLDYIKTIESIPIE